MRRQRSACVSLREALLRFVERRAQRGSIDLRPVAGVPLCVRVLRTLEQAGIREAVVITGYQGDRVRRALLSEQSLGLSLTFVENPRFDVYVPKSIGPISKVMNLLPRSGREAVEVRLSVPVHVPAPEDGLVEGEDGGRSRVAHGLRDEAPPDRRAAGDVARGRRRHPEQGAGGRVRLVRAR